MKIIVAMVLLALPVPLLVFCINDMDTPLKVMLYSGVLIGVGIFFLAISVSLLYGAYIERKNYKMKEDK